MSIRIDALELEAILALTPTDQSLMLMGKQGIGKSEIIRAHYEARGMRVVPFFLGQMADPGDLIGLAHKDEATGRTVFLPPHWWPEPGEPIVLFLDELNRARPELLQAVQDLTLNRSLAGRRLPEGSVVVAAVNEGDEFQVTDLDPALVSRFNLYELTPTVDDWLVWAKRTGVDARIVAFIQAEPIHLDADRGASEAEIAARSGLVKTPDRRAWARVSQLIGSVPELKDIHYKAVAGIVGARSAAALRAHLASAGGLRADDILFGRAADRKKVEKLGLAELALLNDGILLRLSPPLPTDDLELAAKNLLGYLELLDAPKRREGLAHFASRLEDPRFDAAFGFVASSPKMKKLLEAYVGGIEV